MAKQKYLVKSRLEHDGKLYEPGKSVELDDEAAAPLVAVHVIEPAAVEAEADKSKGKK